MGAQPEGRRLGPGRPRLSRPGRPSGRPGRVTVTVTVTRRPGGPGTSPPPYHPGLPRKGRIYTRPPARCEDSRAIEPNRILEAGEFIGLPERPEMRDTLLFSIKKTHVAPRSSYSRIPHLRMHKLSPGVRSSCPPRGCYPGTTGRSYGHLGLS